MRVLLVLVAGIGVLTLFVLATFAGPADRFSPVSAAGSGPEMAMDVTTGGSCAGGICQVATGATFTLAIDVVTAPAAGYIGMQTFIDYGTYNPAASEDGAGPDSCSDGVDNGGGDQADRFDEDCVTVDLVYKPVAVADEITWPDLEPAVSLRAQIGPGLLSHGGASGLISPPTSTFEGNVVSIQMTCPSSSLQATKANATAASMAIAIRIALQYSRSSPLTQHVT